jgi:outer membrane protein assembly factor BamD
MVTPDPNPAPFRARNVVIALVLAIALTACSSAREDAYVEAPVENLYNGAMDALMADDSRAAIKLFDEVERQHPYSVWATKAQLMGAFARYRGNKYDDAIGALDRFIQLHPGNRDVVYAYYLKALSYYEQITDVGRDQEITAHARASLDELVRRFPDSRYARDAQLKLDLTLDHLAGKEMEIGRYYLTRKQYLAAINRFRRVIDLYQTTTHVPEALHRMTEGYLALGLADEAKKTASVLGHNYPGSEWYTDSYAILTGVDVRPQHEKRGMISRVWNTVF